MSRLGLEVFENTLQKTYEWLNDLQHELDWEDRQKAYLALRGTLHALRDRLPAELAVKFGAQLPMLIRGFYYEGWKPSNTPIKIKSRDEFFILVSTYFNLTPLSQYEDVESIVKSVFKVVAKHISDGEVTHIKDALPAHLASLWSSSSKISK